MSDCSLSDSEAYGRNWRDIAEEMERRDTLGLAPGKLSDRLCRADRPQESIDAVLDEASNRFEHCILFRVQGNVATVWGARGWIDQTGSLVNFVVSPVSGNPLELLTIHPNYRGVAPVEQAYVPFFARLDIPFPAEISLTPVEVNGRVVGILYGDCGECGRLRSTETQDLELAARLAFGFTLILIKNKIRAFSD